jgi:hypothetical protein
MAVRSVKNQYRGINAHLHSLFQAEGGWSGFHTRHVVHIADVLAAELLPKGYVVEIEESLQIRRNFDTSQDYRADLLIADQDIHRASSPTLAKQGEWMPVAELLDEEELSEIPYRALSIAPRDDEPIVWIELLSPTNKGQSEDAQTYRTKRKNLLSGGLVFVELDYLHETSPTFSTLPYYYPGRRKKWLRDAHPYWLVVIDPRPDLEDGKAQVIGFDVDAPIPLLEIPLTGGQSLNFDFGVPYQRSFDLGMVGHSVDYSELPRNFDRYSPADQLRIAQRMLAVLKAHQAGVDLETSPLTVDETISLEEALEQIATLR